MCRWHLCPGVGPGQSDRAGVGEAAREVESAADCWAASPPDAEVCYRDQA